MIYLFTGSNGSGKTLNSIKFICEELNPNGDRPVFYYAPETQPIGIAEAGVLDWQALDIDTCRDWFNLPEGSIILVDEFRHVWPWRNHKDPVPESVDRLAEHRSKGFDFILTAQKPASQFDPAIQGFIEEHRHLEGVSGSKKSRHFVYQTFCSSPMNPPKLQAPEVTTHAFDKKYYSYYRSASLHTHKDRLPYKKLIPIVIGIISIPTLFYFAFSTITDDSSDVSMSGSAVMGSEMMPRSNGRMVNTDDYILMHTPRIEGLPHTAPVYDDLMKPVVAPKPAACIIQRENLNRCRCWTNQATLIDMPHNVCVSIAEHRYFDHTRVPPTPAKVRYHDRSESRSRSPNRQQAVLIRDSSSRQASAQAQPRRAAPYPNTNTNRVPSNSPQHFNNR